MSKNETRTYTLPKELVKQIQNFAKKTERTESGAARYIIKEYFEKNPQ